MAWKECDSCGGTEYTELNPFVEFRTQRPSDKTDMCCTMAGHKNCLAVRTIPDIETKKGCGVATPQQWEDWIEGDGQKAGYLFLG